MTKILAIDPSGCGCTECIIGEYVPLDQATPKQVRKMLNGKLGNNTGWPTEELKRYTKTVLSIPGERSIVLFEETE